MNKVLIIAFKFNDIFYGINTTEWKNATSKYLLIFKSRNVQNVNFPFSNYFTNIITITYESSYLGILASVFKILINHIKYIKFDYVILSNINLLITKLMVSSSYTKSIILIEDGLMNYINSKITRNQRLKDITESILLINEKKILKKIAHVYVLSSEDFIGEGHHKQIQFLNSINVAPSLVAKVNNKKIFIGQNLYDYCALTPKVYSDIVNTVMRKFKLDFYVPHLFSKNETIERNILNINEYGCTFEMVAPFINNVEFFSFNSSILFTMKKINPHLKVYMIKSNLIENLVFKHSDLTSSFLESRVDKIISI